MATVLAHGCALAPQFECGEHVFGIMFRGPCALCRSPFDLSDADLRRLRNHKVLPTHVGQRFCSAGCSLLRMFCPTNMRRGDRRTRRRSLRHLDAKSRRGHMEHIMYGSASCEVRRPLTGWNEDSSKSFGEEAEFMHWRNEVAEVASKILER